MRLIMIAIKYHFIVQATEKIIAGFVVWKQLVDADMEITVMGTTINGGYCIYFIIPPF